MTDEKPIRLRVVSVMTDPDGGRHESKTVHRGTLRAGRTGLKSPTSRWTKAFARASA